jgi:hypothetical protein
MHTARAEHQSNRDVGEKAMLYALYGDAVMPEFKHWE